MNTVFTISYVALALVIAFEARAIVSIIGQTRALLGHEAVVRRRRIAGRLLNNGNSDETST